MLEEYIQKIVAQACKESYESTDRELKKIREEFSDRLIEISVSYLQAITILEEGVKKDSAQNKQSSQEFAERNDRHTKTIEGWLRLFLEREGLDLEDKNANIK